MDASRPKTRSHWPLVALSTVPAVLGVLLPLLLVRIVSPGEVGAFKIFFLYLGIAPALSLTSGLRSSIPYWSGQVERRDVAIKVTSTLILLIAVVAGATAYIARDNISVLFQVSTLEAKLFAVSLLGAIAGSYFEEVAIAVGRIWTGALFYCGFEIARAICIVTALLWYRSVTAVLIAHTAISTLKLVVGYVYGYLINVASLSLDRPALASVWRCAAPISVAYVFGVFIGSADQFLLSTRVSSSDFALYSIGCLSIAPLLMYEQSVTRVLIPQMSEEFARKSPRNAVTHYQTAVDNLGFLLIPAVVSLFVFATPIIELFFTRRYAEAAQYLRVFCLSYLLLIIPHDALARARGNSGWILRAFVIFALASLALSSALIPIAGPFGALAGVLISGAAMRAYALRYFRSELSLRLSDIIPIRSLAIYTLLSCAAGAVALVSRPIFDSDRAWLAQAGATLGVVYLMLALPSKARAQRHRRGNQSVLILTQSLEIGGLERMVLHLSRQLKSEGRWRVRVLAYDHSGQKESLVAAFQQAEIPVETFKKGRGFSFRVIGRILRTVYTEDIDVIHSQDLGTLIYAVLASALSLGKVSIVHTQHSFPLAERSWRYRLYRWLFSRGVKELSVVSEDVRQAYAEFFAKPDRIHVIENGVEFSAAPILERVDKIAMRRALIASLPLARQDQLRRFEGDVWILYQARFSPGKGQEHALSLWRRMSDDARQRSVLCMIGPESFEGQYERIESLIRECPDSERVCIVGSSNTPLDWLKAGDVFLSCSEYEGMPLAPLEAAGCGLPLLLSCIPGHSFLKENSFQFSLDELDKGADYIRALISHILGDGTGYQRNLWVKSQHIRERFSVAEMARKYAALYAAS